MEKRQELDPSLAQIDPAERAAQLHVVRDLLYQDACAVKSNLTSDVVAEFAKIQPDVLHGAS